MTFNPGMKFTIGSGNEYEVKECIGKGGFGIVFKIMEIGTSEVFALKTLSVDYTTQREADALKHDIESAMSIKHENVIRYLYADDGLTDSELPPFIIMEFANGGTVAEFVDNRRSEKSLIDNELMRNMFKQLIKGMSEISKTIIHRDIKTDNILIDNNILKISDFGLAKFLGEDTRSSTLKGYGSRPYLAPEIWAKNEYSIQSDIYAMGIVFYELATLEKPIQPDGANVDAWGNAHLYSSPKNPRTINPNLDISISQAIMKMIVKSRSKRFQTWAEIGEVVHRQTTATASSNSQVKGIVEARLKKDDSQREVMLAQKKKEQEENQFYNKILYQIIDGIIDPLKLCVNEINDNYVDRKIEIGEWEGMEFYVSLISGEVIKIEFETVDEEKCYQEGYAKDGFGEHRNFRKLVPPVYGNRNIMAWGRISVSSGLGYNLILVEKKDELYGEWFTLVNTNSVGNIERRNGPEPFPFSFGELYSEIHLITAMHIYDTQVAPFDIGIIMGMIKEFN